MHQTQIQPPRQLDKQADRAGELGGGDRSGQINRVDVGVGLAKHDLRPLPGLPLQLVFQTPNGKVLVIDIVKWVGRKQGGSGWQRISTTPHKAVDLFVEGTHVQARAPLGEITEIANLAHHHTYRVDVPARKREGLQGNAVQGITNVTELLESAGRTVGFGNTKAQRLPAVDMPVEHDPWRQTGATVAAVFRHRTRVQNQIPCDPPFHVAKQAREIVDERGIGVVQRPGCDLFAAELGPQDHPHRRTVAHGVLKHHRIGLRPAAKIDEQARNRYVGEHFFVVFLGVRQSECDVFVRTEATAPVELRISGAVGPFPRRIRNTASKALARVDGRAACAQLDVVIGIGTQVSAKVDAIDLVVTVRAGQPVVGAAVCRQTKTGLFGAPAEACPRIPHTIFSAGQCRPHAQGIERVTGHNIDHTQKCTRPIRRRVGAAQYLDALDIGQRHRLQTHGGAAEHKRRVHGTPVHQHLHVNGINVKPPVVAGHGRPDFKR